MGGFFKGNPWQEEKSRTTHHFALLWGEVIQLPKVRKDMKKRYVEVLVKYKSKTYLVCKRWSDYKNDYGEHALDPTNRAMENLRKHDMVLVLGRYDVTPYVNKDGVEKVTYNMRVDMIIPQDTIAGLAELQRSYALQNLLKLDAKYADKIESAEDEYDEDYDEPDMEEGVLDDGVEF